MNDGHYDFDAPKKEREDKIRREQEDKRKGITLAQFGAAYFDQKFPIPLVRNRRPKRRSSIEQERAIFKNLERYLGDVPLAQITSNEIQRFVGEWIKFPIQCGRRKDQDRNPVPELRFLRYLLNLSTKTEVKYFGIENSGGQTLLGCCAENTDLTKSASNGLHQAGNLCRHAQTHGPRYREVFCRAP